MALLEVICWAIIFIARIRFPPGKSLATILNQRYNNGALEAFRKFQRLELKLGKAKLDLDFLSTCKKRSVIPRFLWFKVANADCEHPAPIDNAKPNYYKMKSMRNTLGYEYYSHIQVTTAHSNLASLVSNMDVIHIKHVSDRENSNRLCQHQRVQDRKIFRLCTGQKRLTNSFNPDDVVFNFSNRLISDKEKEILSKGLNFAVPPTRLNACSFLTPFEKFYNQLKKEPVNARSGFFPESIKARLKDVAYSGFRSYSRPNALYSQEELSILKDNCNDITALSLWNRTKAMA